MFLRFLLIPVLLNCSLFAWSESLDTQFECRKPNIIQPLEWKIFKNHSKGIVISNIKLEFPEYPRAFNPSIIKFQDGYLLSFRYLPKRDTENWVSYIGLVRLDSNLKPISKPQLLNTRNSSCKIPSQAEDARLYRYKNKIYLTYNDSDEVISPHSKQRRDIFVCEVVYEKNNFAALHPIKLIHKTKYNEQFWQKNWVPFEYGDQLFFTYSINPHEILYPNMATGECHLAFETRVPINWNYGTLRGSTPPLMDENEYLAFFHSGICTRSEGTGWQEKWHYFMGAYQFSASPPFQMTKISPFPIFDPHFYDNPPTEKAVIFPGGFVISGNNIYVAYGKHDEEIWIAHLDKTRLKESLFECK
jgi:predicted GH43/DUF377 family glycosyl hydrolase